MKLHYAIYELGWHPESHLLYITNGVGSVEIRNPLDFKLITTVTAHPAALSSIAFSPNGFKKFKIYY